MIIGYARTSTKQQEAGFEDQIRQLKAAGCEKIFSEQVSAVAQRAELERALAYVREGDTFIVTKLDRLARSVENFLKIQKDLEARQVVLRILDFDIDSTTPTGRLILGVIAHIAEFERNLMLERQRVGLAKAHKEGKIKGRPKNPNLLRVLDAEIAAFDRDDPRSLTVQMIAKKLGISRAYVYQRMRIVAPEKMRPRIRKKEIIKQVYNGDEELYNKVKELRKRQKNLKELLTGI